MITPLRMFELAESANPPNHLVNQDGWWTEVEFKTPDGWSVWFFYDGDELDYIDYLVSPDGSKLDPWASEYDDTSMRDAVVWWCGVGDLERLRSRF